MPVILFYNKSLLFGILLFTIIHQREIILIMWFRSFHDSYVDGRNRKHELNRYS